MFLLLFFYFIIVLQCSYLQVLETKKGIPISLCIIYSCVARRLGVVCEPVSFPTQFLLRWMENPMYVQINS